MSPRLLVVFCALAAACARSFDAGTDSPFAADEATLGAAPQLVKDIRTGGTTVGSFPSGFVTAGSATYFVARTPDTGTELWKTDGTAAGTRLVKDIAAGAADGYPGSLTAVGTTLFFTANETSTGVELWRTDGTEAGTVLVRDIRAGTSSSSPNALTAVGNLLYFQANDGVAGVEPWVSDGTPAGTRLLLDVYPGRTDSFPAPFVPFAGKVFFRAKDATHGTELWVTDGSSAGTRLFMDFHPTGDGIPDLFTVCGNSLLLSASDPTNGRELWKTDGTVAGTKFVKDIAAGPRDSYPASIVAANGTCLFSADDGVAGRELWRTDGTEAGTVLVKDIQPGATGSYLQSFAVAGNTLFFSALTSLGNEVWKSDGTAAGTVIVKDIYAGSQNADPTQLVAHQGAVYFAAEEGTHGRQLWRSDGTAAGTAIVRVFATRSGPSPLVSSGGKLWFGIDDGLVGFEPWTTDGTSAGTNLLLDLAPGHVGGEPQNLTAMGSTLYFTADDGVNGRELWKSDGTAAGTVLVKDIMTGSYGSAPSQLTPVNGTLFFNAYDPTHSGELWKSDGTTSGTVLVKDIATGFPSDAHLAYLTAVGSRLFFVAEDGTHGPEPYVSDGSAAGTFMLQDLAAGTNGSNPSGFVAFNGAAYFFAYVGTASAGQLYRSDGVTVTKVVDVHRNDLYARPRVPVAFGNVMLFTANSELATGFELWSTDATAANTVMLKRIEDGGILRVYGAELTVAGGTAFFPAQDTTSGMELWATDGTAAGTRLVKDIQPGLAGSSPTRLVALGNRVYFLANDGTTGRELWTSDGTEAGTRRVVDTLPGDASGAVNANLLAVNPLGPLFFGAADATRGAEPWQIPLGSSTPALLGDVAPGAASSNPRDFTRVGGRMFFSADDGTNDRELWGLALPGVADTTPPQVSCPADLAAEATSATGGPVSFLLTATDDQSATPVTASSPASGASFPMGVTTVNVTATDDAGNVGRCSFRVTVADRKAPRLTCPASFQAEATGAQGANVTYAAATASDEVSPNLVVTYSQASGTRFALGATTVTASAGDAAGNLGSCTFTVTVADTRAPRVTCPVNVVAEATGPTGAVVAYPAATATDDVTASSTLAPSAAPGSTFALGVTKVGVAATDAAGNKGSCSFTVTVRDTTAPAITCPDSMTVVSDSTTGLRVTYPAPTATDLVTAGPTVASTPASGSLFPSGTTDVHASATDAAGNVSTCVFHVVVSRTPDVTAPVVTCPDDVGAEATGPGGARVRYDQPTATDDRTARPRLSYSASSGAMFPLGLTTVTVTARDDAGNTSSCSVRVSVTDTVAPQITCPPDVTAQAPDAAGTTVAFAAPAATDVVTLSPEMRLDHASESLFPVGATTVTATAADSSGNAASCTFRVTVNGGEGRSTGCGCSGADEVGLLALVGAVLLRRRRWLV